MNGQLELQVEYHSDDRLWVFTNRAAVLPAGPALLHLGPTMLSVSLAEPELLAAVVVDVIDPGEQDRAAAQVEQLIGPEASRLIVDHNPDRSVATTIPWAPALGARWPSLARLALLSQLETLSVGRSPWWAAEWVARAEPLLGLLDVALPADLISDTARQLVTRPRTDHERLATRAQTVNGPTGIGPAEVLEALARAISHNEPDLGRQLAGLAQTLVPDIDSQSLQRFHRELSSFRYGAPEPVFLGGRTKVRVAPALAELAISQTRLEPGPNGVIEVWCRVPGEMAVQALDHLWARAVEIQPDGTPGALVALGRFHQPTLDTLAGPPPNSIWESGDHELRANLALPAEVAPEAVLIEITARPVFRAASDIELARGEALRTSVAAAAAARTRHPDSHRLGTEAIAAHLEADDLTTAEHQRVVQAAPPDAALGELDDQA